MKQEYDDMIDVGVLDFDIEKGTAGLDLNNPKTMERVMGTIKQMTPPKPNNSEPVVNQVMHDLHRRKVMGIKKYGTPLQAHNGRCALQDAYEEALDLCCYLKQKLLEDSSSSAPVS